MFAAYYVTSKQKVLSRINLKMQKKGGSNYVKSYERLKLEVMAIDETDVITGSKEDNIGGLPDDWEE